MQTKIYVGNLSYNTSEDDLRTLFTQAGTVTSVALIKDRDTGQSKGFAFIEMSSQAEAEKAIQTFNDGASEGRTRSRRRLRTRRSRRRLRPRRSRRRSRPARIRRRPAQILKSRTPAG
ncbi:MAG: RNA-binding protein [Anaerolineaceae bacterium]|nr:MAG: RNA-binding protein [Anaerolineaceae bacterium]